MELLREGLPVLLGAGASLTVSLAGFSRGRPFVMAALVLVAGATASALNGELASWPNGLFAVMFDSALAAVGALACIRLLRRRPDAQDSRLRAASTDSPPPTE